MRSLLLGWVLLAAPAWADEPEAVAPETVEAAAPEVVAPEVVAPEVVAPESPADPVETECLAAPEVYRRPRAIDTVDAQIDLLGWPATPIWGGHLVGLSVLFDRQMIGNVSLGGYASVHFPGPAGGFRMFTQIEAATGYTFGARRHRRVQVGGFLMTGALIGVSAGKAAIDGVDQRYTGVAVRPLFSGLAVFRVWVTPKVAVSLQAYLPILPFSEPVRDDQVKLISLGVAFGHREALGVAE